MKKTHDFETLVQDELYEQTLIEIIFIFVEAEI
jgi:hypothetical protein